MRFLGHGLLPCGNTPVAAAMCSPPPRLGGGGCAHTPPRGGLLRNAQYAPSCAATRLRSIRRACRAMCRRKRLARIRSAFFGRWIFQTRSIHVADLHIYAIHNLNQYHFTMRKIDNALIVFGFYACRRLIVFGAQSIRCFDDR